MKSPAFLRHPTVFVIFGAVAAFCTYASMYAFRKGITATTFAGISFAGIDYKIWLITAQVLGYAVSKGLGIKVVSEMSASRRAVSILGFVGFAWLALLGFAVVPAPWNIVFLFLNGLPLGMVYGVVLGFLEGRRQTDALVAGLTASFIFASGFVKTVALTVYHLHETVANLKPGVIRTVALMLHPTWRVSEYWLPFVTGSLFVLPLLGSVFALSLLPPPTADDLALRTERKPMTADERRAFIRNVGPGLVLMIVSYVLLSAFRDFRDNFGPEILRGAGVTDAGIFARSETFVAVGIVVLMGSLSGIRDNFRAFGVINGLLLAGGLLVGGSTWAHQSGLISPGLWFALTGMGLYAAYVPCNGLYFERLVASFRYVSTVGFIVTLADYYGYLGSVAVLLYKNFGQSSISYHDFFVGAAYGVAGLYTVLVLVSYGFIRGRYRAVSTIKADQIGVDF